MFCPQRLGTAFHKGSTTLLGGGCLDSLPWERTCCGMVPAGPQSWHGLHVLGSPLLWLTHALMLSCPLSCGLILPCSCLCSIPLALSQVFYHSCGCSASGQVLESVGQPSVPAACSPGRVLAPTLGSPAPWVSQHGCAAAHGSAWAPLKEMSWKVTGCLGKQDLALAGHTRKIKTSGQATAE